ncbi:hypothetical protein SRABI106_01264 [Rahnella aquatilis]|nr:hypothetical protein SRABI106_01264 [Rahnella aquatilis]
MGNFPGLTVVINHGIFPDINDTAILRDKRGAKLAAGSVERVSQERQFCAVIDHNAIFYQRVIGDNIFVILGG